MVRVFPSTRLLWLLLPAVFSVARATCIDLREAARQSGEPRKAAQLGTRAPMRDAAALIRLGFRLYPDQGKPCPVTGLLVTELVNTVSEQQSELGGSRMKQLMH